MDKELIEHLEKLKQDQLFFQAYLKTIENQKQALKDKIDKLKEE